ncbi:MAG: AarF/ABC1/UbiB kinase family protein [Myxococcota bacterium]
MLKRPLARTARLARAGLSSARRLATSGAEGAANELVDGLGELRGLAAKVGQMASYLDGVAPEDPRLVAAFARLRARTVTSDPAEIREVVEEDLGAPIAERFARWDDEPLASASLGQVHRAALPDGTEVAVKVQHPGIAEAVAADMSQVDRVASLAKHLARGVPVEDVIAEVRAALLEELDGAAEAAHQAAYVAAFRGDPDVDVPEVFAAWCGPRVLTTRFAEGATLEDVEGAPLALRTGWARATWRLFVDGALRTGLLHGDPHPGNLLYRGDGTLVALDFGSVVALDPEALATLRQLLQAGLDRDEAAIRAVLERVQGPSRLTDAMIPVWQHVLAPLGTAPFRLDRAHGRALTKALIAAKDPRITFRSGNTTVPPWFLLAHRTFMGLVSVLGHLDAPVDYRSPTIAALAAPSP